MSAHRTHTREQGVDTYALIAAPASSFSPKTTSTCRMDSLVTRDAELLEHAERSLAGRVGLGQNDEVLDIELPARGAHGAVGGSRASSRWSCAMNPAGHRCDEGRCGQTVQCVLDAHRREYESEPLTLPGLSRNAGTAPVGHNTYLCHGLF